MGLNVAIEVGHISDGLWTWHRGEGRWALNLAEALALAGHRVALIGAGPRWGGCPPVQGIDLVPFGSWPPGTRYDAFFDACWRGAKPGGYVRPPADVYMHAYFSAEVDAELPLRGHCRVHPYATIPTDRFYADDQPYRERTYFLPLPIFKGEMAPPRPDAPALVWTGRVPVDNPPMHQDAAMTLAAMWKLAVQFGLEVDFIRNPYNVAGRFQYTPGQEVLEGWPYVHWHDPLPHGPFKQLLTDRARMLWYPPSVLTGSFFDGVAAGAAPLCYDGGPFTQVGRDMGLLLDDRHRYYEVGRATLGDPDRFRELVRRCQSVVRPHGYEAVAGTFADIVERVRNAKEG